MELNEYRRLVLLTLPLTQCLLDRGLASYGPNNNFKALSFFYGGVLMRL